jgi:hypothetical protein
VTKVHNKPIQSPRKGSNKKSKIQPKAALVWRTEQCSVHHRTVSGAPGRNDSELASFGNSGSHSAIIYRIIRCGTGLSGVPAEQRLLHANSRLQRNSGSKQCAPARAEVRAEAEGALDSE